jgi:hypothetical protein
VVLVGGVAPTTVLFGRYLHRKHGVYPKDLWSVRIMTLGSVPGINTRYEPVLGAFYGPTAIREIYGATEGMFGQQMDERRAWVPNYDLFFFEVKTGAGVKMLYEMRPGEMGSLVVSTPILPRYEIGDLFLPSGHHTIVVLAAATGGLRCIMPGTSFCPLIWVGFECWLN